MRLGFFTAECIRKRPGMAESDPELCRELVRMDHDVRAVAQARRLDLGEVRC